MATVEVRLPKLGDMVDAEVVAWIKGVGERVTEGEQIVEVDTAKATTEIDAPATGVITQIHVAVGGLVEVGDSLATIETD